MQSLKATRLRIEKFVYSKGTNVALYNVEKSKEYQGFKRKIREGLTAQIKVIAGNTGKLNTLLLFTKGAADDNETLLREVTIALGNQAVDKDIDITGYLVWAGEKGGQAAVDKLGLDALFGLTDPRFIKYFDNYKNLLITTLDDTTRKWIAGKIQEGKTAGLTPDQIANTLIDDGKEITKLRAERIVLTETAKAMSTVELEFYRRYGVKEKVWRTSRDERVCPICAPLNGKRAYIGDTYGEGYTAPPAHVSCRCYLEQVLSENFTPPTKVWLGS